MPFPPEEIAFTVAGPRRLRGQRGGGGGGGGGDLRGSVAPSHPLFRVVGCFAGSDALDYITSRS